MDQSILWNAINQLERIDHANPGDRLAAAQALRNLVATAGTKQADSGDWTEADRAEQAYFDRWPDTGAAGAGESRPGNWNRQTLVSRLYNDTPTASLNVEAGAEIQRLRAELAQLARQRQGVAYAFAVEWPNGSFDVVRSEPKPEAKARWEARGATVRTLYTTPASAQAQGEPVATVIKHGAERQLMSETLGSLPDGMYSLYLGPAAQADEVRDAWRDVLAERKRQVEQEGWTPAHDDQHGKFSMSYAAACYALADSGAVKSGNVNIQKLWEWTGWSWFAWWKPKDRRRNLVRAGALILAEIERLDRTALKRTTAADNQKGGA